MLHGDAGWRCGRSHRLYAFAALCRQKPQTVIVQWSHPTLMPDDARQPREIRLETIYSLRYCVETNDPHFDRAMALDFGQHHLERLGQHRLV